MSRFIADVLHDLDKARPGSTMHEAAATIRELIRERDNATVRADRLLRRMNDPFSKLGHMEVSLESLLRFLDFEGDVAYAPDNEKDITKFPRTAAYLIRAAISQADVIGQACGKVLGYPWYKDDQKNFPGATDAEGVCIGEHVVETIVSELANAYANERHRADSLAKTLEQVRAETRV